MFFVILCMYWIIKSSLNDLKNNSQEFLSLQNSEKKIFFKVLFKVKCLEFYEKFGKNYK